MKKEHQSVSSYDKKGKTSASPAKLTKSFLTQKYFFFNPFCIYWLQMVFANSSFSRTNLLLDLGESETLAHSNSVIRNRFFFGVYHCALTTVFNDKLNTFYTNLMQVLKIF